MIKIDPVERRIGLSIRAAKLPEEDFVVDESMLEGLRPGEGLVDLAGEIDAAIEEWRPGENRETAEEDTPSEEEEAPSGEEPASPEKESPSES